MSTIRVKRISQLANRFSEYAVLVDGKKVGVVGNGGTCLLSVEPGRHEVVVRQYRRWRSPPAVVKVRDGETAVVEVGCNLRGWRMWVPFMSMLMTLRSSDLLFAHSRPRKADRRTDDSDHSDD